MPFRPKNIIVEEKENDKLPINDKIKNAKTPQNKFIKTNYKFENINTSPENKNNNNKKYLKTYNNNFLIKK